MTSGSARKMHPLFNFPVVLLLAGSATLAGCGQTASTVAKAPLPQAETQPPFSCFSAALYEVDPRTGYESVSASIKARVEQITGETAELATKVPSQETTEDTARSTAKLTSVTALLQPEVLSKEVTEGVTQVSSVGRDGVLLGAAEVTKFPTGGFIVTKLVYLDPRWTPGKDCTLTETGLL